MLSRSQMLAVGLSVSLVHAQTQTPTQPSTPPSQPPAQQQSQMIMTQDQTPVIKVTTRLVQISVVVHDKKGNPISDLTKDDFAVFEKGQEQKISVFSKEVNQAPAANLAPLPDGVVSNRLANAKSGGTAHLVALPNSLTVILLDGLNTKFSDQHYAKEALVKFLNQLQPGDRVAIYTLSNGLRILHDFTS